MKAMSVAAALVMASTTSSAAEAKTAGRRPVSNQAVAVRFERKSAVDRIIAIIRTQSAFPEIRERVIASLLSGLSTGRYDTDDHGFASRVTSDLLAASGDKHLYLVYDPTKQATLSKASRPAKDTISAPAGLLADRFARENHGLVEQKILAGNVRYLNIVAFDWTDGVSAFAYDDALRFLRGGDAVVIDLRENAGGIPDAVRYLLSYFAEPRELIATFYQGTTVTELRTLDRIPGGRFARTPLYVLTSGRTASAAEAFAYYVSSRGIGEIIGERSAGAGNIKDDFPIDPGFVLSVSVARSVDPVTLSNWEGVGVAPTVATPASQALAAAHVRALERLSADTRASTNQEFTLALRLARARWQPSQIGTEGLTRYAGTYGDRRIWVEGDRLYWRRGDQTPIRLEPLGDHWFLLGDTQNQARFAIRDDRSVSVTISRPDGDGAAIARSRP